MKKPLLLSTVFCALAISACTDSRISRPLSPADPQAKAPDSANTQKSSENGESWKQVTTLAQSITGVEISPSGDLIRLTLKLYDFDHVSTDGTPAEKVVSLSGPLYVRNIAGELRRQKEVSLTAQSPSDYSGQLVCLNSGCSKAEISVTKESGKLTGTSVIRYVSVNRSSTNTIGTRSSENVELENGKEPSDQALASALRAEVYVSSFAIYEISSGLRNFFSIQYVWKSEALKRKDAISANPQIVNVSGEISENGEVSIHTRHFSSSGALSDVFDSYPASVEANPEQASLTVRFKHPNGYLTYLSVAGNEN